MKFADLHCDTPFELYKKNADLCSNKLHISIEKCREFKKYLQVAAIWCDCAKNNEECFDEFYTILYHFKEHAAQYIVSNKEDISKKDVSFIIAVEDARLINYDLSRIEHLYAEGVKLITLTWKNISCIGGAWNTDVGLTNFGKDAVKEMLSLGQIPDVSHGSYQLIRDVYSIAEEFNKPFCATHSNSFAVHPHQRNITDEAAKLIANSGGIIGISLCPTHISYDASIVHLLLHIEHYISIIGEDSIAFGCDFDGISSLPRDIKDITSIKHIYSAVCREFGEIVAEKIFFNNTYNFLLNNI